MILQRFIERLSRHLFAGLLTATLLILAAPATARDTTYTVAPGDTLLGIAIEYGVTVAQIRQWNRLSGDTIRVGQRLTLRTSARTSDRVRRDYTIRSGDTGLAIARRLQVSWADLQRWNRRTNFDRLQIGQKLTYYVDSVQAGESRGAPSRGRLLNPTLLSPGNGFQIRRSDRAWGTDLTVAALRNGLSRVQARFIDAPALMIHDISTRNGGPLAPHASHQNGRDVDASYYRNDCDELCDWQDVGPDRLDVERTWYLFRYWLQQELVEFIFVDEALIEPLYVHARDRGASESELNAWFQFGGGSSTGAIRHWAGHRNHFHVRFVEPRN